MKKEYVIFAAVWILAALALDGLCGLADRKYVIASSSLTNSVCCMTDLVGANPQPRISIDGSNAIYKVPDGLELTCFTNDCATSGVSYTVYTTLTGITAAVNNTNWADVSP